MSAGGPADAMNKSAAAGEAGVTHVEKSATRMSMRLAGQQ